MSEKVLTEFRTYLTSQVAEKSDGMTLAKFDRDYRKKFGDELPFRRLNYLNAEDLLKANSDLVAVSGGKGNIQLYPINKNGELGATPPATTPTQVMSTSGNWQVSPHSLPNTPQAASPFPNYTQPPSNTQQNTPGYTIPFPNFTQPPPPLTSQQNTPGSSPGYPRPQTNTYNGQGSDTRPRLFSPMYFSRPPSLYGTPNVLQGVRSPSYRPRSSGPAALQRTMSAPTTQHNDPSDDMTPKIVNFLSEYLKTVPEGIKFSTICTMYKQHVGEIPVETKMSARTVLAVLELDSKFDVSQDKDMVVKLNTGKFGRVHWTSFIVDATATIPLC